MDRVKWIEAKGKKILYTDFSGLKTLQEQIEVLNEQKRIVSMLPGRFLGISNFTDTFGSSELQNELKKGSAIMEAKAEKMAILGITGVRAVLFQAYLRFTGSRNTKAFKSEAEAINYLVS